MLKAGALYFAIVIAFFLAIISASLIMLAAHYRNAYLRQVRFEKLLTNLESGITYVLTDEKEIEGEKNIDLYDDRADSVSSLRKQWGIFDLAVLRAYNTQDTIQKAFLIGNKTDSTALHLTDEDRPLSVSGNTQLTGNIKIPKSGIKQSYAEGKPYTGKKVVYGGEISNSGRSLEMLSQKILQKLKTEWKNNKNLPPLTQKEMSVSFLDSTRRFNLSKEAILNDAYLNGNIILYSDSAVTIGANAQLNNIQVYSRSIRVENGFKGNVQLFATDSVVVAKGAVLNYPSVIGVIKEDKADTQPHVTLGENVVFKGILFTYETTRSPMQTLVSLGKDVKVNGEVYSTGFVKLGKGVSIYGKVSCNRFIMQTPTTLYENFLIDVVINRKARNQYYLSSKLFAYKSKNEVLTWLN